MAYTTQSHLEIVSEFTNEENKLLDEYIDGLSEDQYFQLQNAWNGDWDWIKWYNSEEDMRFISQSFPNLVFCLSTIGEDGESWKTYAKDGKVQVCSAIVTYEEYDESELQ